MRSPLLLPLLVLTHLVGHDRTSPATLMETRPLPSSPSFSPTLRDMTTTRTLPSHSHSLTLTHLTRHNLGDNTRSPLSLSLFLSLVITHLARCDGTSPATNTHSPSLSHILAHLARRCALSLPLPLPRPHPSREMQRHVVSDLDNNVHSPLSLSLFLSPFPCPHSPCDIDATTCSPLPLPLPLPLPGCHPRKM
ncbi:hypothetical protein OG21DRAFT_1491114 [Imleria badia]|nr:hypothetical protein OG21DRAFT_1491114 [Imleria badia]